MLIILLILSIPIFVGAQVINWIDFDERHMDTVMFNVMNDYVSNYKHPGDYLMWSSVVQKEVMPSNYNFISDRTRQEIHSLHNMKWVRADGLPIDIKNNIIKEKVNLTFLNGQKYTYKVDSDGNTAEAYGTFDYSEILISVPGDRCETYQEIANHCIHSWDRSKEGHAEIMNANYKKKVIVGTITFYCKETHRVFISFVYIS